MFCWTRNHGELVAKVCDFGLVQMRIVDDAHDFHEQRDSGTLAWKAPEEFTTRRLMKNATYILLQLSYGK